MPREFALDSLSVGAKIRSELTIDFEALVPEPYNSVASWQLNWPPCPLQDATRSSA